MSEVPTLSYATPGLTPPAGATFTLHERPDGIQFERTLAAEPYLELYLFLLAGLASAGIAVVVLAVASDKHWRNDVPAAVVGAALLAGFAAFCWAMLPATFERVQTVELVGRDLFVTNGQRALPNRRQRYANPRRVGCSLPGTDVLRMRVIASLWVRSRIGLTSVLVTNLARAECQWVAAVLQAELDRRRDAVAVGPV